MDKYKESFALEFAKLMQENLPKWREIQEENKRKIYINIKKRHIAASPAGFCNMPL